MTTDLEETKLTVYMFHDGTENTIELDIIKRIDDEECPMVELILPEVPEVQGATVVVQMGAIDFEVGLIDAKKVLRRQLLDGVV